MKLLLKVLIALAVVWIGISGTVATTPVTVVCNSIKNTAGEIDYSISYTGVPGLVTANTPTTTLTNAGGVLSAFIQGQSIANADAINTFMLARSAGGDLAATGLDVDGVVGHDATVSNYNMYGYVTSGFAYAAQYAGSVTGNSIYTYRQGWSLSSSSLVFNPPPPPAVPNPSTFAGATNPGTITMQGAGQSYAFTQHNVGTLANEWHGAQAIGPTITLW